MGIKKIEYLKVAVSPRDHNLEAINKIGLKINKIVDVLNTLIEEYNNPVTELGHFCNKLADAITDGTTTKKDKVNENKED